MKKFVFAAQIALFLLIFSSSAAAQTAEGTMSILAIFVGGIAAGFNPCLFAAMVLLGAYTLAQTNSRRAVVKATLPFIAGVLLMYFTFGITVARIIVQYNLNAVSNIILAAILALFGLLYIARHRKEESVVFRTPKFVKSMLRKSTERVSMWFSFALGALFAAIKAPCGILYIAVFEKFSQDFLSGLQFLAAFNIGLVLPLLVIAAAFWLGYGTEGIRKFRERNKYKIRFFAGVLMLLTAALILVL